MPLFTDTGLVAISDLEIYESTLSKVVSTHGINIDSKTTLTLAAIGDRLLARLMRAGVTEPAWLNSAASARFSLASLPPQTAWVLTLNNVVVTDPLKRWICYEILSQIFSEAYSVQLNDRFKEKWADYAARSKDTEQSFYTLGIGVVFKPLPQPATPVVAVAPGNLPAGIVTVQTTWVDAQGHEGLGSPLVPVTLTDSSSFIVSIVPAQATAPAAAVGWNVYVQTSTTNLMRQNTIPIALSSPWQVPSFGFVSGLTLQQGQNPDCFVFDPQRIRRG